MLRDDLIKELGEQIRNQVPDNVPVEPGDLNLDIDEIIEEADAEDGEDQEEQTEA